MSAAIASAMGADVSGPVATTHGPGRVSVSRPSPGQIIWMSAWLRSMASTVTRRIPPCRPPASPLQVLYFPAAAVSIRLPRRRISSFKIPTAFSI